MPSYPISRALLRAADRLLAPRQAARNAEIALTAARRTRTWWHSAVTAGTVGPTGAEHGVQSTPTP